MAETPRIVVIGAGLAGLAAGWRLVRAGARVRVLERSDRVGGRLAAERADGFTFEPVPAVVSAGDRRLLTWIDEAGLRDELLPLRPLVTALAYEGELRDVGPRGLRDVARLPGVGIREGLRLVRLPRLLRRYGAALDPECPGSAARFDDRSLADFGRLYFGPGVFEQWLAPRVTSLSLGDPHQMSRVQALQHLHAHGHGRPGLVRGALDELAAHVAGEVGVVFDTEVAQIESEGSGLRIVRRDGRSFQADGAVIATPAAEAARIAEPLLSLAERDAFAAVRYDAGVSVAAALCRTLGSRPRQVLVPRPEGGPLETAVVEPGLSGGRAPEGRAVAVLRATGGFAAANFDAPDETLEKELVGNLERLWPGFGRAVEHTRVFRTREGSPRFDVGRYRELARFERVQADRRAAGRPLVFAGDYLVHPTPEGAITSAQRAADALLPCVGLA